MPWCAPGYRPNDIPALTPEIAERYALPRSPPVTITHLGLPLDTVEDALQRSTAMQNARGILVRKHQKMTGQPVTPLHPDAKGRPSIRLLATQVGMPHWALKKRARELGLARTKEKPWSEPELEILARYAWMSDERIRLKLKAAGYSRTVTGIHLKLKRMQFKQDVSFYSANGLAQALGIDNHTVARWIRAGHLKAKRRGTERTEQQGGDTYLIHEKDVRRFILKHPTEIDLRKVDQLWFLDLITNGLVCSA